MGVQGKPFQRMKLDEELNDNSKVFTVRLNADEMQMLYDFKKLLDINSDGKALKVMAKVGYTVLHNTFGEDLVRYLFKKERVRGTDYVNFDKGS